ncbi:MAG: hypothetical protein Unbinned8261contig1001_60 [Prokaryotic dsDNA virus sp.]|nr:MAG: hypothetical protein Unbinned8261contig1001_60 [Prokaryotic dsDNA virus sp.]|tara:strand:+ start:9649 stop:10254 length:606 start_codon:yes stop_codon:yes gene_type:complete
MIKFSLESSTNLRDLIRKLSVGLGKLVSTVNELNTFVGFRGEWSIVDHGTRVSFTGNAHDQRFDHPSNVSMYLSKVQYDPQNAYDNTTGVYTIPSTGYYQVNIQLGHDYVSENDYIHVYLDNQHGDTLSRYGNVQMADSYFTDGIITGSSTHYLNKGDTLELTTWVYNDTSYYIQPFRPFTWVDNNVTGKGAFWEIRKIGK